jgi:hypothetical protein
MPGNKKASREDPGGSDHDGCVKRLAPRQPPAGKRRKGKAQSALQCRAGRRTGLHVFVKRTDIYGCDAHERINAHQSLFVNGFDSICMVHNGFRSASRSVEKWRPSAFFIAATVSEMPRKKVSPTQDPSTTGVLSAMGHCEGLHPCRSVGPVLGHELTSCTLRPEQRVRTKIISYRSLNSAV